ncbi:DinB family protein [Paenibacillus sp. FSL K6-1330]|uniref:DinB family protein n=1 Tax=Paenibacillus sp. FSL K6-1330 TaxID=2975292 RepID=UPI0030DBCEB4
MDLSERKQWNENHKKLTQIILDPAKHQSAVDLFLQQHRLLHSSRMSHSPIATLEDELVKDLQEETFRQYPVKAPDTKNSIIWHMWHITRIEDMTMSVLVNNDVQVLHSGQWNKKLHIDDVHSGNEMTEAEIANLSAALDIGSLLAYRSEVGRNTREVISRLLPGDFKQKVEAARIHELKVQHAVKEEAS